MENYNNEPREIKSALLNDKTCPVCGGSVFIDDGYGSMEMQEYCEVDRDHYRYFINFFTNTITVNGRDFSDNPMAAREYIHELEKSQNS